MATGNLDQPEKAKKAGETTEESKVTEFDMSNPFTKGAAPTEEDEAELKFDDEKSLYVAKGLLSAMSPVFDRMFKSDFKERNDRCIRMSGKEYDPFLDMLLYVHPIIRKNISDKWATKIYEYAHEYQMDTVLFAAEDVLCKKVKAMKFNSVSSTHAGPAVIKTIDLARFADKYSISKLLLTAEKKLSFVPRRAIKSTSSYDDLTSNSKIKILEMRLDRVDNNMYLDEK